MFNLSVHLPLQGLLQLLWGRSTLPATRALPASRAGLLCGPPGPVVLPRGGPACVQPRPGGGLLRGLWRPEPGLRGQAHVPQVGRDHRYIVHITSYN